MLWVLLYLLLSYLIISFIEWAAHKFVMHTRVKHLESIYDNHTIHHQEYHGGRFYGSRTSSPKKRFENLILCAEHTIVLALPFILLIMLVNPLFGWILAGMSVLHSILFNSIHVAIHLNHSSRVPQWFRNIVIHNHYMHHIFPKKHFSVVYPGFDYLVGTVENVAATKGLKGQINDRLKMWIRGVQRNKPVEDNIKKQDLTDLKDWNFCLVPAIIKYYKKIMTPGYVCPRPKESDFIKGRQFFNFLRILLVGKISVVGAVNLPKNENYILAANHTSLNDMLVLLHIEPRGRILAHRGVLGFLGPVSAILMAKYLGYFAPSIKGAVKVLQTDPVVICPEGWAFTAGEYTRPFKRGAVVMAKESGVPIIPVNITYGRYPGLWIYSLPIKLQFLVCALMPWLRSGAFVHVGEPFAHLDESMEDATELLRQEVIELGYISA